MLTGQIGHARLWPIPSNPWQGAQAIKKRGTEGVWAAAAAGIATDDAATIRDIRRMAAQSSLFDQSSRRIT
jgi:hypothetical protein